MELNNKQIIEKLDRFLENEVILTPQQVRDLLNKALIEDIELEEDEKIVEKYTIPGDYKLIGLEYADEYLITEGDYNNYIEDMAHDFAGSLPDGIDDFFNTRSFIEAIKNDFTYTHQIADFINNLNEDDYECYQPLGDCELDGIKYVAMRIL